MKRSLKTKLIVLCVMLFSVFLFAGCGKLNDTLDDVLDKYKVEAQVTYYSGEEGWFGKSADGALIRSLDLYYKADQKALNIGIAEITSGTVTLSSNDYEVVDWLIVKTDEQGNPLFEDEENSIPQTTGESFDFSKKLESGKHYYLSAVWRVVEKLDVKLLNSDLTFTLNEVTYNYKAGDIIASFSYGTSGSISDPGTPVKTNDAYTFLEYYTDAEGTTVAQWPISRKNTGENNVVYAKYLEGEWTLLKKANDVMKMFTSSTLKDNYYLFNHIDCSSLSSSLTPLTKFSGKFYGNGYTISNINFIKTKVSSGSYAVFGEITEGAEIKDVTFSNIKVSYETRSGSSAEEPNFASFYLAFTSLASGARVENVTFDGGSVQITLAKNFIIENMMNDVGDAWTLTNWQFGGFDSDSAYVAYQDGLGYTGVTVTNIAAPAQPTEE